MKLLLIDDTIHYQALINARKDDVDYIIFNYENDTYKTLIHKICLSGEKYSDIAIVQHSKRYESLNILFSEKKADAIDDYNVFKDFIIDLNWKVDLQRLDLLACSLYNNPKIRSTIAQLEKETGIDLRASINFTGNPQQGGTGTEVSADWIMESDNVDIRTNYFTDAISEFKDLLYYASNSNYKGNKKIKDVYGNMVYLNKDINGNPINPAYDLLGRPIIYSYGSIKTWGNSEYGGTIPDAIKNDLSANVISVCSTSGAFTALKYDGSIICWGNSIYGAILTTEQWRSIRGVIEIVSTSNAFAVLKSNGTVITWGIRSDNSTYFYDNILYYSVNYSSVTLSNIKDIYATQDRFVVVTGNDIAYRLTDYGRAEEVGTNIVAVSTTVTAFALLRRDGAATVIGSGTNIYGPGLSLTNIKCIFASKNAFAALKNDGSVVSWGWYNDMGTPSSSRVPQPYNLRNVSIIYSNDNAFAALTTYGSVICWGNDDHGSMAEYFNTNSYIQSNVISIASTHNAFAALKSNGDVIIWGPLYLTANTGKAYGVNSIFSNYNAFAFMNNNKTVTYFDISESKANASTIISTTDVVTIYSNYSSFAAIRSNGSVQVWGDATNGGSLNGLSLSNVATIYSTIGAYAALEFNYTINYSNVYNANGGGYLINTRSISYDISDSKTNLGVYTLYIESYGNNYRIIHNGNTLGTFSYLQKSYIHNRLIQGSNNYIIESLNGISNINNAIFTITPTLKPLITYNYTNTLGQIDLSYTMYNAYEMIIYHDDLSFNVTDVSFPINSYEWTDKALKEDMPTEYYVIGKSQEGKYYRSDTLYVTALKPSISYKNTNTIGQIDLSYTMYNAYEMIIYYGDLSFNVTDVSFPISSYKWTDTSLKQDISMAYYVIGKSQEGKYYRSDTIYATALNLLLSIEPTSNMSYNINVSRFEATKGYDILYNSEFIMHSDTSNITISVPQSSTYYNYIGIRANTIANNKYTAYSIPIVSILNKTYNGVLDYTANYETDGIKRNIYTGNYIYNVGILDISNTMFHIHPNLIPISTNINNGRTGYLIKKDLLNNVINAYILPFNSPRIEQIDVIEENNAYQGIYIVGSHLVYLPDYIENHPPTNGQQFEYKGFVIKYDLSLNQIWSRTFFSDRKVVTYTVGSDKARGLSVNNGIYVLINTFFYNRKGRDLSLNILDGYNNVGSVGFAEYYTNDSFNNTYSSISTILKFDNNGNFIPTFKIAVPSYYYSNTRIYDIQVRDAIYFIGSVIVNQEYGRLFGIPLEGIYSGATYLMKYDFSCNRIWTKYTHSYQYGKDYADTAAIPGLIYYQLEIKNNFIYIVGYNSVYNAIVTNDWTKNMLYNDDDAHPFIIKVDTNGSFQWIKRYDIRTTIGIIKDVNTSTIHITGISITNSVIYVIGRYYSNIYLYEETRYSDNQRYGSFFFYPPLDKYVGYLIKYNYDGSVNDYALLYSSASSLIYDNSNDKDMVVYLPYSISANNNIVSYNNAVQSYHIETYNNILSDITDYTTVIASITSIATAIESYKKIVSLSINTNNVDYRLSGNVRIWYSPYSVSDMSIFIGDFSGSQTFYTYTAYAYGSHSYKIEPLDPSILFSGTTYVYFNVSNEFNVSIFAEQLYNNMYFTINTQGADYRLSYNTGPNINTAITIGDFSGSQTSYKYNLSVYGIVTFRIQPISPVIIFVDILETTVNIYNDMGVSISATEANKTVILTIDTHDIDYRLSYNGIHIGDFSGTTLSYIHTPPIYGDLKYIIQPLSSSLIFSGSFDASVYVSNVFNGVSLQSRLSTELSGQIILTIDTLNKDYRLSYNNIALGDFSGSQTSYRHSDLSNGEYHYNIEPVNDSYIFDGTTTSTTVINTVKSSLSLSYSSDFKHILLTPSIINTSNINIYRVVMLRKNLFLYMDYQWYTETSTLLSSYKDESYQMGNYYYKIDIYYTIGSSNLVSSSEAGPIFIKEIIGINAHRDLSQSSTIRLVPAQQFVNDFGLYKNNIKVADISASLNEYIDTSASGIVTYRFENNEMRSIDYLVDFSNDWVPRIISITNTSNIGEANILSDTSGAAYSLYINNEVYAISANTPIYKYSNFNETSTVYLSTNIGNTYYVSATFEYRLTVNISIDISQAYVDTATFTYKGQPLINPLEISIYNKEYADFIDYYVIPGLTVNNSVYNDENGSIINLFIDISNNPYKLRTTLGNGGYIYSNIMYYTPIRPIINIVEVPDRIGTVMITIMNLQRTTDFYCLIDVVNERNDISYVRLETNNNKEITYSYASAENLIYSVTMTLAYAVRISLGYEFQCMRRPQILSAVQDPYGILITVRVYYASGKIENTSIKSIRKIEFAAGDYDKSEYNYEYNEVGSNDYIATVYSDGGFPFLSASYSASINNLTTTMISVEDRTSIGTLIVSINTQQEDFNLVYNNGITAGRSLGDFSGNRLGELFTYKFVGAVRSYNSFEIKPIRQNVNFIGITKLQNIRVVGVPTITGTVSLTSKAIDLSVNSFNFPYNLYRNDSLIASNLSGGIYTDTDISSITYRYNAEVAFDQYAKHRSSTYVVTYSDLSAQIFESGASKILEVGRKYDFTLQMISYKTPIKIEWYEISGSTLKLLNSNTPRHIRIYNYNYQIGIYNLNNTYKTDTTVTYQLLLIDGNKKELRLNRSLTFKGSASTDVISTVSITYQGNFPIVTIPRREYIINYDNSSAAVNLSVTKGYTPYTFTWKNTTDNVTLETTSTPTYTFYNNYDYYISDTNKLYNCTVKDASNSTADISFSIIYRGYPILSATAVLPIVSLTAGTSGRLEIASTSGGKPPLTNKWYDLSNSTTVPYRTNVSYIDITNPELHLDTYSKNYECIISDISNHTYTLEYKAIFNGTASQPLYPVVDISNITLELNSGGQLKINSVSGGTSPYTYEWYIDESFYKLNTIGYIDLSVNDYLYLGKDTPINYKCIIRDSAYNFETVHFTATYKAYNALDASQNFLDYELAINETKRLAVDISGGKPSYSVEWYSDVSGGVYNIFPNINTTFLDISNSGEYDVSYTTIRYKAIIKDSYNITKVRIFSVKYFPTFISFPCFPEGTKIQSMSGELLTEINVEDLSKNMYILSRGGRLVPVKDVYKVTITISGDMYTVPAGILNKQTDEVTLYKSAFVNTRGLVYDFIYKYPQYIDRYYDGKRFNIYHIVTYNFITNDVYVKDVAIKSYGDTTVLRFDEQPPPDQGKPTLTSKFLDDPLTGYIIKEYNFTDTITLNGRPEIVKLQPSLDISGVEPIYDPLLGKTLIISTFSYRFNPFN